MKLALFALPVIALTSSMAFASGSSVRCQGVLTTVENGRTSAQSVDMKLTTKSDNATTATLEFEGITVEGTLSYSADGSVGTLKVRTADRNFDLTSSDVAAANSSNSSRYYATSVQTLDSELQPDGAPFTGVLSCQDIQ